jgi:hypothetical protein
MKGKLFAAVMLAVSLAVLLLPPISAAYEPPTGATVIHYQGQAAWASFFRYDESGCIYTAADLNVSENMTRQSGSGSETTFAESLSIGFWQYDVCSGQYLLSAYASFPLVELPGSEFTLTKGAKSAALKAIIPLVSWPNGTSFDVLVDLTWTATDSPSRSRYTSQSMGPGYMYRSQTNGLSSPAAMSGTLSDGVINLGAADSYGYISASQLGQVFVFKGQ